MKNIEEGARAASTGMPGLPGAAVVVIDHPLLASRCRRRRMAWPAKAPSPRSAPGEHGTGPELPQRPAGLHVGHGHEIA
jgi:hypothetical protein